MKLFQRLNLLPTYIPSSKLLVRAFPRSLETEVRQLVRFKNFKVWTEPFKVTLDGEELGLPYRVIAKPFDVSALPVTQQTIYHCLNSRNTDGYVRETSVKALLNLPMTDWVIPYLFLALTDYVFQVANAVASQTKLNDQLAAFARKNPELYKLALARALSYWNLNRYEGFACTTYQDFPPYKMLASLNMKK